MTTKSTNRQSDYIITRRFLKFKRSIMRNAVPQSNAKPAKIVEAFLPLIKHQAATGKVLDLACGSGRNGLFLLGHNIPVIFADNNASALENIAAASSFKKDIADLWLLDIEAGQTRALDGNKFDVIMVFNYLHRPVMSEIKDSLVEGGLILYETFTTAQAAIGRPGNPDYLLEPGELKRWFKGWEMIHYFEGADDNPPRFYASLVARKPPAQ